MKHWSALAAVTLPLVSSGCFFDSDPPRRTVVYEPTLPTAPSGTLTARWSIDGVMDPNQCVKALVTDAEVSVVDASGREVGAWRQPCRFFSMSVGLAPGTYSGSAILLDGAGNPRTTRVFIDPFTIAGRDVFDLQVDFPASSFL